MHFAVCRRMILCILASTQIRLVSGANRATNLRGPGSEQHEVEQKNLPASNSRTN